LTLLIWRQQGHPACFSNPNSHLKPDPVYSLETESNRGVVIVVVSQTT